ADTFSTVSVRNELSRYVWHVRVASETCRESGHSDWQRCAMNGLGRFRPDLPDRSENRYHSPQASGSSAQSRVIDGAAARGGHGMRNAHSAMRLKRLALAAALLPLAMVAFVDAADARITRIVIAKTSPAFGGASFGSIGAYEQLDGTAYGELDPRDPLNAIIQDLELAPRNAAGMVEYSMDISILKPVDMSKSNRTLLYETVNRGRKNLPFLNIGGDQTKAGDGFLQRQGYAQAWSGWEGDITTGLRIAFPVGGNADGSPITRRVRAENILSAPRATVNITAPPAYEAASLDNADAVLTRRVHQGDARERIDNGKWRFADCSGAPFPGKPDAAKVCLEGGFDTNHIYELVYTGKNP